jgi:GxxExxY protein
MEIVRLPGEDSQTHVIIGAAIEVHRCLGPGFLELVYQEALAIKFANRLVPYIREAELRVIYKNQALPARFRVDFLCFGQVLVELKAVRILSGIEEAQALNYLRASGKSTALLFNFAGKSLVWRRFVGSPLAAQFSKSV